MHVYGQLSGNLTSEGHLHGTLVGDHHKIHGTLTIPSGGGGGSSDFSTATITVNGSGSFEGMLMGSIAADLQSSEFSVDGVTWPYTGLYSEHLIDSATIVLYKGGAVIEISMISGTATVTGNAEQAGIGQYAGMQYLVTGDCTITLN